MFNEITSVYSFQSVLSNQILKYCSVPGIKYKSMPKGQHTATKCEKNRELLLGLTRNAAENILMHETKQIFTYKDDDNIKFV